jgi:diguanylate cyclase (GGDEF)-like protein
MRLAPDHVVYRNTIWATVGVIGLAVLAIGFAAWSLRSDQVEAGTREAERFATILSEQTTRSVEAIDRVLGDVQERVAALPIRTPEDFSRLTYTPEMFRFLNDRLAQLPQATVVTLSASDGNLVNSTRRWPRMEANFLDRDYFQHFRTTDDADIYVSFPVTSWLGGKWTVYFNKRINAASGAFAGVVSVGVEMEYFRNVYEAVGSSRDHVFALVRRDGMIIWRYPDPIDRSGSAMPVTSPWYATVANGGGSYRSKGAFDGGARLVAVRPLEGLPLVVNVGLAESAVLATWNWWMAVMAAGTLLVIGCAILLLRALAKQLRRLIVSEAELATKSEELASANARLDAAMNNVPQGVCMFDAAERLVVCNARYLEMYGLSPAVVGPGTPLRDILRLRRRAGNFSDDLDRYLGELRPILALGNPSCAITHLPDGRVISVRNQPAAAGAWVATHEDITERQQAEARVAHMARHDALTDLPNRTQFSETMEEALVRLGQSGHPFNVLLFDLDQFKAVNDSLGHPIGDDLLKAIACRLRESIPDKCTVARLGGDEFAILQAQDGDQHENAIVLAKRLQAALSQPYSIDGHQIVIGVSIGIAVAPADGTTYADLLKSADLALYQAKGAGRNAFRFFRQDMDAEAKLRRALEGDLRNALSRGQFELLYQTIIDVRSLKVCGVETLLRWRHPTHGVLTPDRFIPLAEESGLIVPIGEWIVHRACAAAATWPDHVKLAVNLSAVQFGSGDLVGGITDALVESGLSPDRLELEITESVLLRKDAASLAVLHQLKSLGLSIALDDFGTGFSSLSYLRGFPFDKIKIDKSFVAELEDRADCAAIVCAITGLGRSLHITTTAEGVETAEQFELLRAAACTEAQGFLFSQPVPASDLVFDAVPARAIGNVA